MRISTKITLGFLVLILLIVGVFSYQVALIHRMQSITQNIGSENLRAAELSLQMFQDADQVMEFTRKLDALGGDPDYANQLQELRGGFSDSVSKLLALKLSPAEQNETKQLATVWNESQTAWERQRKIIGSGTREGALALGEQTAILEDLLQQTQAVTRAARLAIEGQVQTSEGAAMQVERISLLTAFLALLVSVAVSIWIVGSISGPLRRLTEGTRAVAQGEFNYRLADKGSDELSGLARSFNQMTERLTELDQMKKDFVSHASHELKTPLASMQETIRLMLEEIPGPLNEQQRRLLELNLQSGSRLSGLIANLLDLSRMEAGVMEYVLERSDLAALIRSAVAEFELPLLERNLRLDVQAPNSPLWIHCDGARIIQVINNLLGNALKFSPSGTTLRLSLGHQKTLPQGVPGGWAIRVSSAPHPSGFAVLSLADRGPGVPAEERTRIFEKFHQVHRDGKKPGHGTGLGLAISRTIVEAHAGALWVQDNPEGGSIFCLLLPAEATVIKEAPRASAPI